MITDENSKTALGRLQVPKAAQILARQLRSEILDTRPPEGTRMWDERELLRVTGLGRGVIREALRLLESDRLITVRPGKYGGIFVRYPTASHVAASITLTLDVQLATLHDLFEARRIIEPAVAALVAERAGSDDLDKLERVCSSDEARLGQSYDFHVEMGRATGNKVLVLLMEALGLVGLHAGRSQGMTLQKSDVGDQVQAHLKLIEAFRAGDADLAARRMRKHLVGYEEIARSQLGDPEKVKIAVDSRLL